MNGSYGCFHTLVFGFSECKEDGLSTHDSSIEIHPELTEI